MSDEEEQEYFDEEQEAVSDQQRFATARGVLEARCAGAGIVVREEEDIDGDKFLVVSLPNGKEKRELVLTSADRIEELLAIPFERFVVLGPYDAIASYADGTIECAVRPIDNRTPVTLFRRLFGPSIRPDLREAPPIEIPQSNGIAISIALRSLEFAAFLPIPTRQLTIRMVGVQISQHDQAVDLLERVAGALFLQMDIATAVPFSLVRRRARRPLRGQRRADAIELRFPATEYDAAPLSLYWYGRAAVGMPLLQFLAYYQVLEFYFPVYSQAEAQRRVQNIIKDPTFRAERDADINRVLSAARVSPMGSFGDERSQLRSTIAECIDPGELRVFLTEDSDRRSFFAAKAKGLTSHKLAIDNPNLDLRNDVADRIYDIRCKIVHTKGGGRDGELELLLPYSPEAEMLYRDIELLAFIATKVLIAASSPLRIQ